MALAAQADAHAVAGLFVPQRQAHVGDLFDRRTIDLRQNIALLESGFFRGAARRHGADAALAVLFFKADPSTPAGGRSCFLVSKR